MTKKLKKKRKQRDTFSQTKDTHVKSRRDLDGKLSRSVDCTIHVFLKRIPSERPLKRDAKTAVVLFIFLLFLFSFYTHKAIVIPEQVIALSLSAAVRKYLVRDVGVQRFVNFGLREARRMLVCKIRRENKICVVLLHNQRINAA